MKEQLAALKEVKQSSTDVDDVQSDRLRLLEVELNAKDKQISQLLDDIRQSQSRLHEVEKEREKALSAMRKQMDETQAKAVKLEKTVESYGDYDEIKKELKYETYGKGKGWDALEDFIDFSKIARI